MRHYFGQLRPVVNEQFVASAHEAYLHGQLAKHARGRERHRLSGRERSDETDRRVGPQRGDQAITFGFDGVGGDARQRAEVDAPALNRLQRFGVDATRDEYGSDRT